MLVLGTAGAPLHDTSEMNLFLVRRIVPGLLVLGIAAGREAAAQTVSPEPGCAGPAIAEIDIVIHPFYGAPEADSTGEAGLVRRVGGWLNAVARKVHRRTRHEVIERELLFAVGDCMDELALSESGRILRELPFLADADVRSVVDEEGMARVEVETREDWTLRLDVRPEWEDGLRFVHISATEENLMGRGLLVGLYARRRDEERDLGGQLRTIQLAGTRMDAHLTGGRTRTGVFFTESLTYPFVGELGRWAFVESYALREDLFPYAAPAGSSYTNASLPMQTRYAEATLGRRLGTPGDLTVLAGGMSWEDVRFDDYPAGVEVVSGFDFSVRDTADQATIDAIGPQVGPRRGAYLNLLAGKRRIRFLTRRGLDAVRGVQDVRVGTQALLALGGSLGEIDHPAGDDGRELRGSLSLFAGSAGSTWIFNSELTLSGSGFFPASPAPSSLRDLLGEFGAALYWHPGARHNDSTVHRHTLVFGLTGAGGWNNTLPFQLTVGGSTGLRGYDREDFPAARRIVATIEDRITLDGPFRDLFDLGLVVFADVGAGWRGDVPFGTNSGLLGSAGAGFRIALPSGARQVVRLDLAVPVEAGGLRQLQFRIGSDGISLLNGFANLQLRRSRTASPAAAFLGIN